MVGEAIGSSFEPPVYTTRPRNLIGLPASFPPPYFPFHVVSYLNCDVLTLSAILPHHPMAFLLFGVFYSVVRKLIILL